MQKSTTEFVANCQVCQQHKASTQAPAGLLKPLPVPKQMWEDIAMDFMYLGNGGYTFQIWPLHSSSHNAQLVAAIFSAEVYRLHGLPKSVVSDRDPLFLSQFWKAFLQLQGTTLSYSSTYHPQNDGQTEVLNRCLEAYLHCFVSEKAQ